MLNKVADINEKQVPADIIQKFKVKFSHLLFLTYKSSRVSGRWHMQTHLVNRKSRSDFQVSIVKANC